MSIQPSKNMNHPYPNIVRLQGIPPPPLEIRQLHILVVSLNFLTQDYDHLGSVINQEEQTRAERFINPAHGNNFAVVRGMLRCCLSHYIGIPAEEIRFTFNQYGKPELAAEQNAVSLHFNVSHSHEMAAFAFAKSTRVGIDIEYIKPVKNIMGLANHVCSPVELAEFEAMSDQQRAVAFFRLWTRKEAFIKANGQGLSMGLRSITIGLSRMEQITSIQYKNQCLDNWYLKDLDCDPAYRLAIASELK